MSIFIKLLIGTILIFLLYYLLCSLLGLAIWVLIIAAFAGLIIGILRYLLHGKRSEKAALYTHPKMERDAEKRAERALKELERKHREK